MNVSDGTCHTLSCYGADSSSPDCHTLTHFLVTALVSEAVVVLANGGIIVYDGVAANTYQV